LFLTTSIAGRTKIEREVLYDEEVCLLEKDQGRVLGITSCFVYEVSFKTNYASDSIMLEAAFIVELIFEHLDNAGECINKIKKLSCKKRLSPDFHELLKWPSKNENLLVVPVINDLAYRYVITEDGTGINLTLSASIEYFATFSYYSNIIECGKEQPETGDKIESVNWRTVINSIGLDDALTCIDHLVKLIKISRLFGNQENTLPIQFEASESKVKDKNCSLKKFNKAQEYEIQTCKKTIAHLKSELREREEIISKLLLLLDKYNGQ
jgi:hypothetical protein